MTKYRSLEHKALQIMMKKASDTTPDTDGAIDEIVELERRAKHHHKKKIIDEELITERGGVRRYMKAAADELGISSPRLKRNQDLGFSTSRKERLGSTLTHMAMQAAGGSVVGSAFGHPGKFAAAQMGLGLAMQIRDRAKHLKNIGESKEGLNYKELVASMQRKIANEKAVKTGGYNKGKGEVKGPVVTQFASERKKLKKEAFEFFETALSQLLENNSEINFDIIEADLLEQFGQESVDALVEMILMETIELFETDEEYEAFLNLLFPEEETLEESKKLTPAQYAALKPSEKKKYKESMGASKAKRDATRAKPASEKPVKKPTVDKSEDERKPLDNVLHLPKSVLSKLRTQVHPMDRQKVQDILMKSDSGVADFMAGRIPYRKIN